MYSMIQSNAFENLSKDRHHMYDTRTEWEDPRSQRNFCTSKSHLRPAIPVRSLHGRPTGVLLTPEHCPIQNKTKISADNSPNFFSESAWKNDLKELLNEINE